MRAKYIKNYKIIGIRDDKVLMEVDWNWELFWKDLSLAIGQDVEALKDSASKLGGGMRKLEEMREALAKEQIKGSLKGDVDG